MSGKNKVGHRHHYLIHVNLIDLKNNKSTMEMFLLLLPSYIFQYHINKQQNNFFNLKQA